MKHLKLNTTAYLYVIEQYEEWLQTLGYAPKTAYNLPIRLREFLHYSEQHNIYDLNQLSTRHIQNYYRYIRQRKKKQQPGALSNGSINNQRYMLISFTNYLRQTGRIIIPAVDISCLPTRKEKLNTLSEEEVQLLFHATYSIDENLKKNKTPLGERDRAMLAVYYACGLRRSEGVNIKLDDIDSGKQCLHIKKGKGYKERIVPVHPQYLHYIEEYIANSRYQLLNGNKSNFLFINERARPIKTIGLYLRLQKLVQHTGRQSLIQKAPSLHTLRHSIATHLLHKGVKIEQIAKFLGHSSIESTEIYTHNQL